MNASPTKWSEALWRAVLTLLVAAGGAWLAARLFAAVWELLLVLAVVVFAFRLALGVRGRREW